MTPVLCMMPFAEDMNYGRALNDAMAMVPEDGWAVFLDHDAMWTTRSWNRQIREAIALRPDAGLFTAVTNRIARSWQRAGNRDSHEIVQHRRFGLARTQVRTLLDITDTNGLGGVVMVISKAAWSRVGGFADGFACVDHQMHFAQRAAGSRVWLIEGLYVYHWRRANGDGPPSDAPRASGCPCSGSDRDPRRRVTLP